MEYRKFYLTLDQQSPSGSTGVCTADGGIIWVGDSGTFPSHISSQEMSADEILKFKTDPLLYQLMATRLGTQSLGYVCSNGIKMQVMEQDLLRWTQLMTGLIAFQPPQVSVRDFDNIVHTLPLAEVYQMLGEIFAWGQAFIADTWAQKDAIIALANL